MADYPGSLPSFTAITGSDTMDDGAKSGASIVSDLQGELLAVATELGTDPAGASATVRARLDALDSTVSGKAASSHAHTASDVTDFAETVRDTIGSALVAGTNVTITVNDGADTITIDAAGGGGLTEEQTEDIVNGLLVAGANISLTYDDVANTLTVAVTGLGTAAALSTADIDERARDAVGTALTAGTGITVTPNDGADTITVATSALLPTLVDAKGDLLVGTAADTVARLAIGATAGHVLTVDSAEPTGMKWAAVAGRGVPTGATAYTYDAGWSRTLPTDTSGSTTLPSGLSRLGTASYVKGVSGSAYWTGASATGDAAAVVDNISTLDCSIYADVVVLPSAAGGRVGIALGRSTGTSLTAEGTVRLFQRNDGYIECTVMLSGVETTVYTSPAGYAVCSLLLVSLNGGIFGAWTDNGSNNGTFTTVALGTTTMRPGLYVKNTTTGQVAQAAVVRA